MDKQKKRRIFDLINIKEWEVKLSVFITIVFAIVFVQIDCYNKFFLFENVIENLAGNMLNALIGLLGFSLSGISIIVALFSAKEAQIIDKINGKGKIYEILEEYVFLAINIGIQCVMLIIIFFLVSSELNLPNKIVFYIAVCLEVYHVTFIVFYTVALVKNCIKLYKIKSMYSQIENAEKTIHDTVNEVKIDYIFSTLINNYGCSQEEVIDNLVSFVDDGEIENKELIKNYIKKQYDK